MSAFLMCAHIYVFNNSVQHDWLISALYGCLGIQTSTARRWHSLFALVDNMNLCIYLLFLILPISLQWDPSPWPQISQLLFILCCCSAHVITASTAVAASVLLANQWLRESLPLAFLLSTACPLAPLYSFLIPCIIFMVWVRKWQTFFLSGTGW